MAPLRTMKFDEHANAYIIRDTQSVVRALLHTQQPIATDGTTPRNAAASYLNEHRKLLGLTASELRSLGLRPKDSPVRTGSEYRFVSEKRQFDVTTVTFQLTHSGAPVRDAGISVHLKEAPVHPSGSRHNLDRARDVATLARRRRSRRFQVVCAQTTGHNAPAARAAMPPPKALKKLRMLDEKTLARKLGLAGKEIFFDIKSLRITNQLSMIYRYDRAKLRRAMPSKADYADPLAMLLPPVPAKIVAGKLYVVMAVYFDLAPKGHSPFHWLALVEVNTLSILYLEIFAAGINGLVFHADPMTTHGGPPPSAGNKRLNRLRVSVPLLGLASRRGRNVTELVGENVKIVNLRNPQILPPTIPPKRNFDFDVRTDDFAAVNAYYNCDQFFRLVEELGFKRNDYFPGTKFPTPVDHRGFNDPRKNGAEVFAQCKGTGDPVVGGIEFTQFCLAEVTMSSQIGNANDWRYVLHELGGHGVLNNHVNTSHFGFAHSAGDSFAAILNDPESKARDLGSTFPWTPAGGRRHDRTVKSGWGWDGQRDRNDRFAWQDREQILRLHTFISINHSAVEIGISHQAAAIGTTTSRCDATRQSSQSI